MRRILYGGSVHDDDERDAVLAVLDDPNGLRIGKHVAEMEAQVAALFGKRYGVMCNSGSSALYLAVELLDLPPGSEVLTSPLTFSTDIAPLVRAGLVPVFVDVEVDTFQIDVSRMEEMITDATRAILVPNLAGNAPDWDAIRAIADQPRAGRDRGLVRRARRHAARHAHRHPRRHQRHQLLAEPHHHLRRRRRDGGRRRSRLARPGAAATPLGTALRVQLYGSRKGERDFWEDLDGIRYDSLFIFDELGWNFGPSELGAAFGLQQLKKLPANHARRQANFAAYTEFFRRHPGVFVAPRQTDGLDTAWLSYLVTIDPTAGFSRSELQQYLEARGIDTRTAWTGNAARQPMMKGVEYRQPAGGLPNADRVMEYGMLLPCGHGLERRRHRLRHSGIAEFLAEREDG